jgi:hypothetical protein
MDEETKEEHAKVEEKPSGSQQLKAVPSLFGVSALEETLCKLAFLRLGCYGNNAQKSSSAYARIVWMLAYLRHVFEHLRNTADRHKSKNRPVPIQEGILKQVLAMSSDVWTISRKHATVGYQEEHLLATFLQPLPGIGVPKRSQKLQNAEVRNMQRFRGLSLEPALPSHWINFRTALLAVGFTRKLKAAAKARGDGKSEGGSTGDVEEEEDEMHVPPRLGRQTSAVSSISSSSSDDLDFLPEPAGDRRIVTVNTSDFSAVEKGRKLSDVHNIRLKIPEKHHERAVITLDELFETEAGVPCVLEGHCGLCAQRAGREWWGNPKCRGCSITDSLAFEFHPFKRLLQQDEVHSPPLLPAVADMPRNIERCNLTPPLLGSLGQKYRDEFGHVG